MLGTARLLGTARRGAARRDPLRRASRHANLDLRHPPRFLLVPPLRPHPPLVPLRERLVRGAGQAVHELRSVRLDRRRRGRAGASGTSDATGLLPVNNVPPRVSTRSRSFVRVGPEPRGFERPALVPLSDRRFVRHFSRRFVSRSVHVGVVGGGGEVRVEARGIGVVRLCSRRSRRRVLLRRRFLRIPLRSPLWRFLVAGPRGARVLLCAAPPLTPPLHLRLRVVVVVEGQNLPVGVGVGVGVASGPRLLGSLVGGGNLPRHVDAPRGVMIAERVYPVVREVVRGTRGAPRVHFRLVVVVARVIRRRRRGRGGPSRKRLARQTPHPPRRLQRPPALRKPRLVVIQRGEHVVASLAPARGDPPRGIEPGSARPAARERTDRGIGVVVERRRLRVVLALRQLGRGNDGAAPTAPVDHVRHAPHVPVHVPPRVPAGP